MKMSHFLSKIRPTKVLIALHWLMNIANFTGIASLSVDSWFQEITTSANEIVQELVESEMISNYSNDCIETNEDEDGQFLSCPYLSNEGTFEVLTLYKDCL